MLSIERINLTIDHYFTTGNELVKNFIETNIKKHILKHGKSVDQTVLKKTKGITNDRATSGILENNIQRKHPVSPHCVDVYAIFP